MLTAAKQNKTKNCWAWSLPFSLQSPNNRYYSKTRRLLPASPAACIVTTMASSWLNIFLLLCHKIINEAIIFFLFSSIHSSNSMWGTAFCIVVWQQEKLKKNDILANGSALNNKTVAKFIKLLNKLGSLNKKFRPFIWSEKTHIF